jgi:hypothetical protein
VKSIIPQILPWLVLSASAGFTAAQQSAPPETSAFPYYSAPLSPGTAPAPAAGPAPAPETRPVEPYPTNIYLAPWSRMSIGGDLSPLGIGVKGTIDMNTFMDLRGNFDILRFSPGQFDVSGFVVTSNLQMTSAAAMFDTYPWNSVWRLSAGVMLFNNNQFSGSGKISSGTEFSLDGQNFWSAEPSALPGSTPLVGGGTLGFHRHNPAFILSGGFGKFIPRSERHWSFPSEFGVIFTGAPTIATHVSGWACINPSLNQCANLSNSSNPITMQFNGALNGELSKWRRTLNDIPIYPIFSYSVVYSFDIRR